MRSCLLMATPMMMWTPSLVTSFSWFTLGFSITHTLTASSSGMSTILRRISM